MGKNEKVLVSIIMPTYNCERYIIETLESVLSQSHQSFEVILVDDFSQDSTVDLVNKIGDSRIKVFVNQNNKGAAFSRNFAISQATGEYIFFLDGDDVWLPLKLEMQLDYMIKNGFDFTCTYYEIIDENSESKKKIMTGPKKITHKKFLRVDYIGCLTVAYKREIYPNLCIPIDIKKRNDYALWLKLSEKTDCFCLPELLARYRKTRNSISSGMKTRLFIYHIWLFKRLYKKSTIFAFLFAFRNAIFYLYKKIRYTKTMK